MKFTWTKRLAILTPPIMIISIMTAGGGHGTPIPTLLCYPIFFLSDAFSSGGGPLVWALLLGQFSLYGLIIDIGKSASRQLLAIGLVVVLHITLILITATNTDFWKQWE
jgi:hypothetical protein